MVLYTEKSLEELRQRVNLYEIVSPYVELIRDRDFYMGKCPFHKDEGENFEVIPRSNMYYCHECYAEGDAISFLMIYHRMSFQETVELLSKKYGVELEEIFINKNLENK